MLRNILLVVALAFPALVLADITGLARVVDGDTIWIGEAKIRLWGIDAPESGQTCIMDSASPGPCGEAATAALKRLIGHNPVCSTTCRRQFHRACRLWAEERVSRGHPHGGRKMRSGAAYTLICMGKPMATTKFTPTGRYEE